MHADDARCHGCGTEGAAAGVGINDIRHGVVALSGNAVTCAFRLDKSGSVGLFLSHIDGDGAVGSSVARCTLFAGVSSAQRQR